MASRLEIQENLCDILGSRNVYFDPPESIKLIYPCIVYKKSGVDTKKANNRNYKKMNRYELTAIGYDSEDDLPDRIIEYFQYCSLDRFFTSENLNHAVITLYS